MTILTIQKKGRSDWKSCQTITNNLHQAYELVGKSMGQDGQSKVRTLTINDSLTEYEGVDLARGILEASPRVIAFIDHYPHPAPLIRSLRRAYEATQKEAPLLVFHVFGDFVLNCLQWQAIEDDLKFFKVQFVAASHKQVQLVHSFISDLKIEAMQVIPFPVSDLDYFFSEEIRERFRVEQECQNEFVFVYTGRLSYQKNITTLLRSFSTFIKSFDHQARLMIAGPMDDLAIPYLGKEALPGTFFFHWEEALKEYGLTDKVTYLGNLNSEELFKLYNGSDCYISLSTHNDEDYGMSPAEALATGLPCILSSWGGFISFAKYAPTMVNLVEVETREDRNLPQVKAAFKYMAAEYIQEFDERERKAASLNMRERIGILAVSKKIINMLNRETNKKFTGFNILFYKLCAQFENNSGAPFRAAAGGYGPFYREVYGSYSKKDL